MSESAWLMWFDNGKNQYITVADTRKDALRLFAKHLGVQVSSYLHARKRTAKDFGTYLIIEPDPVTIRD